MVKNVNDEQVKAILYGNAQQKTVRPERPRKSEPAKPYERPTKPGASKAPDGAWTHDLFRNSLADRINPSSGGKRDLLAGQQRTGGMASDDLLRQPARTDQNHRAAVGGAGGKRPVELLAGPTRTPSRTLGGPIRPVVPRQQSAQRGATTRGPRELLASEDVSMRMDEPVRQDTRMARQDMISSPAASSMNIRSRPVEVTVRVDGLVSGTSESDVKHAFSQHFTILSASLTTDLDRAGRSAAKDTISAEIVFPTRIEAEKMVTTFDGIMADGNKLAVYILEPPAPVVGPIPAQSHQGLKLSERMGLSSGSSAGPLSGRIGAGSGLDRSGGSEPRAVEKKRENRGNLLKHAMRGATGREVQMGQADLLESGGIGKMYSDTILQTDPYATVITLEEEQEARAVARQEARVRAPNQRRDRAPRGRGSLANRLGGERGQKAGGGRQVGQSLASRLS